MSLPRAIRLSATPNSNFPHKTENKRDAPFAGRVLPFCELRPKKSSDGQCGDRGRDFSRLRKIAHRRRGNKGIFRAPEKKPRDVRYARKNYTAGRAKEKNSSEVRPKKIFGGQQWLRATPRHTPEKNTPNGAGIGDIFAPPETARRTVREFRARASKKLHGGKREAKRLQRARRDNRAVYVARRGRVETHARGERIEFSAPVESDAHKYCAL